jgi:adenosyl cobinamide kinase/adenosyl cobinamide phosphate guanylyltransferase
MNRALTVANLYGKKYTTFPFQGIWEEVFGQPSTNGIWLIYGKEKNGKTWGTLIIADYLSQFERVLYISAEEGTDMEFRDAVKRAKISPDNNNLHFTAYESIAELYKRLKKRKAPRIVVLDNLTIYNKELRASGITQIIQDFPHHLFICVAHEERKEPYTASAKTAAKLAKVKIHVKGLSCNVEGRVPGGILQIDKTKAFFFHGN